MANKHRSRTRRVFLFTGKILLYFILFSVLWVLLYRFLPPPVTATMILDGNGITKDWVSLDQIDPDMPRAAIGAEDSRFCSHHGFDADAIENAFIRNMRGGKIRGGSTISRSEEHTSELQSLMRISSAVFCLTKKIQPYTQH